MLGGVPTAPPAPMECLGLAFGSDEERRLYFRERLVREWGQESAAIRNGRPSGNDADLLRLSDPPYFTACPNPFIRSWIEESAGVRTDEEYHRTPFPIDSREGKADPLYSAHSYHTKVPPRAIVPSILHFTRPGDVVLDPFSGSGMTGVAAQLCGTADRALRAGVESSFRAAALNPPEWGPRRAVLNDIAPAAAFVGANYNHPFDVAEFERAGRKLLNELRGEIGWMYRTIHSDGCTPGWIRYVVWSQVFACPVCAAEVPFLKSALDPETERVRKSFPCTACGAALRKSDLRRILDPEPDADGADRLRLRMIPCLISYTVDGKRFQKEPDDADRELLVRISKLPLPPCVPSTRFPIEAMYHGSRLAPNGVTRVHHLYLPRPAVALGTLWEAASLTTDTRLRNMLLFMVEQAMGGMSLLNRFSPRHFSHVNQVLSGVYYLPSQHAECSPWYILEAKLDRIARAFSSFPARRDAVVVSTGSAAALDLPDASVDYIFTDPPFGENIPYSDLNFVVESWHRLWTHVEAEAIIHRPTGKGLNEYRELMRACFDESFRVLKPGHWMTVVFHNSQSRVWNAIQEALLSAGFIVAGVRGLDKRQGSYRQVTSSAVRQDLVISAYKPTTVVPGIAVPQLGSAKAAWSLIRDHLRQLPRFNRREDRMELVPERTVEMLYDTMISFHLRRGLEVPLSLGEFQKGLAQRFSMRDGMHFLPEETADYDRERLKTAAPPQLQLFVDDESSAIEWLKRELSAGPRTLQQLAAGFLRETQRSQATRGAPAELADLLAENFILTSAGWVVPDSKNRRDLDRIREKSLLREFQKYLRTDRPGNRGFRIEALRVGFRHAWGRRDYRTITRLSSRLPPTLLEEDATLMMWSEQARLRCREADNDRMA